MNDLISRQAALDALNEQIEQCNKALGSFDISLKDEFAIKVERASLKAYREQLENLPTVQPKHGKWIERESDTEDKENGFETVIVCSCCDFPATTFYSEDCESRTQIRTAFCPTCGADMRKRGEAE